MQTARPSLHLAQTPQGSLSMAEGCVSLMWMLRFMILLLVLNKLPAAISLLQTAQIPCTNCGESGRLIPAYKEHGLCGKHTVHPCDGRFVPGIQYKWNVVPSCEPDT